MMLVWNVKMRASIKRILNVLFDLSLITAALSIGRAATIIKKTYGGHYLLVYSIAHILWCTYVIRTDS